MKKVTAGFVFLLLAFSLSAEQLTTVGVVDVSRVYEAFFIDSRQVRELQDLKDSIQQEIDSQVAILRRLQEQKVQAESEGRDEDALTLDQQIYNKTQYIQDFTRVKQRQLNDQRQRLINSDTFMKDLQSAISFVAESQGFTIVVTANDDKLLWWSEEVDITDLVLERLRAMSR